ncbi:MAG: hypothetical protein PHE58_06860 [Candidatus Omnitrophica bacterium]|nr:hypothetical protein [Candidatus Omnitrophota bacterium]
MIYLFIGQDKHSKDLQLGALKDSFLPKETRAFNLETLYARDLTLVLLQEKLLCLPIQSPFRMVVIKDAQNLKEDIKRFIIKYGQDHASKTLLVLDMERCGAKDAFVGELSRTAKVFRFKEEQNIDTFTLARNLGIKNAGASLKTLNVLLRKGEKPEKILGGLRYVWNKDISDPIVFRNRLQLLLTCDLEIKTGRLKPACAMEKLIVKICTNNA